MRALIGVASTQVEAQGNGKHLYTCFLDLKGAYDRVQRPLLWQLLQRLGVHGVMLRAIQSLYKDSGLTIHINGRRGQTFQSVTGVKQGWPHEPYFIRVIHGWPASLSYVH